MECKHSSGVTQRLARIAGQVNGIRDMVEEGRPCDDLLVQLSSASSADAGGAAHHGGASGALCAGGL